MTPFNIVLFLFISLQPNLSIANITLGSSLTTSENSLWLSPSGVFAFGFSQLNNSNLFLLAIWFNKIPERTIVWYANGNNPVPSGSRVELTTGNLVLMDPTGLVVWKAQPAATISYAALLDIGNFVLAGNDSTYIWESFRNATDTILPSQILNLGDMLFSRFTETNYSKGRFELHFSKGSLELNPTGWPSESRYDSYYSSKTDNANSSESGYQLVFNESADIYIKKMNGEIVFIPPWSPVTYGTEYYLRATLDFNGIFTQYVYEKDNNQGWLPIRSIPENICTAIFDELGSGACGFNSYCLIQDNGKPTCECPPDYVFMDPNNVFGGCKPSYPQGCGLVDDSRDPEELYEFRERSGINWPLGDYEMLEPNNQTECEGSCLNDCSCAVAVFNGRQCWKKRLPLSNGRLQPGLTKVLFKVWKEVPPTGYSGRRKEKPILLGVLLGGSVFFNVFLAVLGSLIVFRRHRRKVEKDVQDSSNFERSLRFFSYEELEEATKGFQEKLGSGSFGVVYKGILKSGLKNVIAVKKLDKLLIEREKEFRTELSAIGKTHHKNLVPLLGYCDEGSHRLLVYEFMSNGTLADFLFTLPRPDWHQRLRIALGIARGLLYLHEECDIPIIHCDIKPQNILLDDKLTARIADFGLAKLLLSDQTQTRTLIRGTRGYVAPEWFKNVPVTAKVDVYSFGVVLLEIICCRRSVVMEPEAEGRAILTDWAYDCYVQGRLDLMVNDDEVMMDDIGRLQKWVMIAIWCIQEDPSKRPTMMMVVEMLEGFVDVPLLPCPSSLCSTSEF